MSIVDIVQARMDSDFAALRRICDDTFVESLLLSPQELMRRENEALAELLTNTEEYAWV